MPSRRMIAAIQGQALPPRAIPKQQAPAPVVATPERAAQAILASIRQLADAVYQGIYVNRDRLQPEEILAALGEKAELVESTLRAAEAVFAAKVEIPSVEGTKPEPGTELTV